MPRPGDLNNDHPNNAPAAGSTPDRAELEMRMRADLKSTARAAALLGLAALAGCTPFDKFPPLCPQLALLKDAADLTRFNGRGEDISDLEFSARLVSVPASCAADGRDAVKAALTVGMEMIRGPAKPDRAANVGYFVAVTDQAGRLLDKQAYTLATSFPPNVDRVTAQSDPVELRFPTSETMHATDYRIYVGLVLSPAEVEYNRRRSGTQ